MEETVPVWTYEEVRLSHAVTVGQLRLAFLGWCLMLGMIVGTVATLTY